MAGRGNMQAGSRRTIGGANCRLGSDGTVHCDFGPRDQQERQRSNNPGPGCYVNTGSRRWECTSLPDLHGRPAQINSIHTDPTTGQTWASVGERAIQVPAFPVSVGRRRGLSVTLPFGSRKKRCLEGEKWDSTKKRCVIDLISQGCPLPPCPNPQPVFGRRRAGRMQRSMGLTCYETCAAQHGKGTLEEAQCQRRCDLGIPEPMGRAQRGRRRTRSTDRTNRTMKQLCVVNQGQGWSIVMMINGQYAWQAKAVVTKQKQQGGQIWYYTKVGKQSKIPDGFAGWLPRCGSERLGRYRNQTMSAGDMALSGTLAAPSTCCVQLGSFPHNGLTFNGLLVCTDTQDPLHGVHVMTGEPYRKGDALYVSFDVGGDVQGELPVCALPPTGYEDMPPIDQPPIDQPPIPIPPDCCVDATTTPPTLQQCSDPSYNGTPVEILDVDEQSGIVLVAVPWSSTPVPMRLCELPPTDYQPPTGQCPVCPPGTFLDTSTGQCVTCPQCPTCPPGHWMAPDGSCVTCPPGYLIDPSNGQCVQCPPGGECPPCPECPPGLDCPPCPGWPGDQPPFWCDDDCDIVPPTYPDPGGGYYAPPIPCTDDACCEECAMNGTGTASNPCNPCRANRSGNRRANRRRRRR